MRLAGSAMEILRGVEGRHLKAKLTPFTPGDTIRVTLRVPEAGKERLQVYEGVVTARRGHGAAESFTVRKISFGVGVERTFPVHSPFVTTIEVVKMGRTRRSKLYFLRDKTGKAAKLKQEYAAAVAVDAVPTAADGTTEATPEAAPAEAAPKEEKKAEAKAEARPAKKEKKAEPKK